MKAFLPAALKVSKRMPVFPCGEGKKTPLSPHGFHDATTDADQLLVVAVPRALVGALTDAGLLRRATLTQYAQRVLLRGITEDLSPGNPGSTATGRAAR